MVHTRFNVLRLHIPDCGRLDRDAWHSFVVVVVHLDQGGLLAKLEDNDSKVLQCEV